MLVFSLKSDRVEPGDSLIEALSHALTKNRIRLEKNDVVAVSSKIVAISERRIRSLGDAKTTRRAKRLARRFSLFPSFAQAVLDDADRVVGGVKGTLLTIKDGDAVANAGIDRKNSPPNSVVLWPRRPDLSARTLRRQIREQLRKDVGVLIVDSRVTPMRLGTVGFAIGCAGIRPVEDIRGSRDLFGRRIEITFRATADSIAATAQYVMGEASEQRPFAIIRGAPIRLVDHGQGIREAKLQQERCLYMSQVPIANRQSSTE